LAERRLLVVLGNQLFPPDRLQDCRDAVVFMAEDVGLCTYVRHHQQKIVLFLAAMRSYADELRDAGFDVRYFPLDAEDDSSYEEKLDRVVVEVECEELLHFEVEDKPMESRLVDFCEQRSMKRIELQSPMFLTTRQDFSGFASDRSRLLMGDFYRRQRQRGGFLLDSDGNPEGGKWSFDEANRRKLPKKLRPPGIAAAPPTKHVKDVIPLVEQRFGDHPGRADEFWWPTTRAQAQDWLQDFLDQRLEKFGPYEDAISTRSETVFHSALSPSLNLGLLTPDEVIAAVLQRYAAGDVPIESVEGFVRQVIGWREFVRGIYRVYGDEQESRNFWQHERTLTDDWYRGTTGIPPLDDAIKTSLRLGWAHHIQRLMVVGNLMTLCEIRPADAWRWFMEMYVDSSEWVMGPNVFGMGIFSDGGVFATKPYICGSNYILKMSDYGKGDWCTTVDGLYWRFIDRHRDFFESNPRLALMPRALDRLDGERKETIFAAAEAFLDDFTCEDTT
jgi:deoxyribodipyrimidine photolyase-related protein